MIRPESRKNLKKLLLILACGTILSGCGHTYSIRVVNGEQYIDECQTKAEEGDTVVITTSHDSAGRLKILVNGSDYGTFTDSDTFDFVMPGRDVEIEVSEEAPDIPEAGDPGSSDAEDPGSSDAEEPGGSDAEDPNSSDAEEPGGSDAQTPNMADAGQF